jgi:hypothetical protein
MFEIVNCWRNVGGVRRQFLYVEIFVIRRSCSPPRGLSKVVLFGDRHRMTSSRPGRNHQEKSTILWLRQIAEVRCEEAARCHERLGDLSLFYHQDAA